mmetsp:Transcript_184258/g.584250  ORF Transcript_184258/g.584250 Transcript_184258/m.584250 type:complete len:343 (+) Transcript_184258:776-1804(+)
MLHEGDSPADPHGLLPEHAAALPRRRLDLQHRSHSGGLGERGLRATLHPRGRLALVDAVLPDVVLREPRHAHGLGARRHPLALKSALRPLSLRGVAALRGRGDRAGHAVRCHRHLCKHGVHAAGLEPHRISEEAGQRWAQGRSGGQDRFGDLRDPRPRPLRGEVLRGAGPLRGRPEHRGVPGRLVQHRRLRRLGRGRLSDGDRSVQGDHQPGRREDLSLRDRRLSSQKRTLAGVSCVWRAPRRAGRGGRSGCGHGLARRGNQGLAAFAPHPERLAAQVAARSAGQDGGAGQGRDGQAEAREPGQALGHTGRLRGRGHAAGLRVQERHLRPPGTEPSVRGDVS